MIADAHYYSFFERAAAIDRNGTTLPLRAGAAMHSDDYGAFGLAWKSAPTLRGSYNRAERYAQVLTSVSTYEVEATNEGAYMHLHRSGERHLGMRLSNEATIASILTISQGVSTFYRHLGRFCLDPHCFRHFRHLATGRYFPNYPITGCIRLHCWGSTADHGHKRPVKQSATNSRYLFSR